MQKLSLVRQAWIGAALAVLMVVTRSHHWATPEALPDASWAVFFAAGFFLRPLAALPALCALAALVDWAALAVGGVSSFCLTPAYAMLVPAYTALWLGGRWLARGERDGGATLARLAVAVVLSALAGELFSSGGFYFLGDRAGNPSVSGFLAGELGYFPPMLGAMAFYVAPIAIARAALRSLGARRALPQA
jgi:hypothetical protein